MRAASLCGERAGKRQERTRWRQRTRENRREQAAQLRTVSAQQDKAAGQVDTLMQQQADTNTRARSIEDNLGAVKDLLVRARAR